METTARRRPYSKIRSGMSWTRAAVWGAVVTSILFAAVNWRGCWLFRYQPRDLAVFLYPFAWLVLFFGVRTIGRVLLLLVAVFAAVLVLETGRRGISEMNAGAESTAVQALHQMQSSLNAYRPAHEQQDHPSVLQPVSVSAYAQKYYRFEYIPKRSAKGDIIGYVIEATPACCDCEFHRSFTIADDGRVFWTLEPRAATPSDMLLPE